MVLAEDIVMKNGKTEGNDLKSQESVKSLVCLAPEGITHNDIKKIKSANKRGLLGSNEIRILSHTYFAPYLFMGAILTIIFRTNVLIFIKILLS